MVKNLTSILLATNLKEYNKVAFDVAMSLAAHYNAKLVLLHVLEDLSEQALNMVKWIIDAEQRKKLKEAEANEARRKLIGKNISSAIIKNSITEYCKTMGTDENICLNPIREVAICEGEVVEEILNAAQEHDVGMIVMAAHEGLFDKSSISRTIRSVLKKATVPVLTVPHVFEK
jgi:nucleotide-binding universal stress UspA family protein